MTEPKDSLEITPEFLRRVRMDNIRTHQVGGITDGVSPERAQDDLGIESDEQFEEIIDEVSARRTAVAKTAGEVICGDCSQVIPCPHVGINSRTGQRYTRGH